MNANTNHLLNSALRDVPCLDATLQETVHTVPLAVTTIAQQCYYTLRMLSRTRDLLTSTTSAFKAIGGAMERHQAVIQELKEGRAVLAAAAATNPAGSSVAAGPEEGEEAADAETPQRSTWTAKPRVVGPDELSTAVRVPQTALASSLELRVVVVGGGTVARQTLRYFLDHLDRDRVVHPSRITVVTRQPERLSAFSALGVRCVFPTHGREPLEAADLVVLATQPAQFADVVKELFQKKLYNDDDILNRVTRLRPTAIVFSCMAAVPVTKMAAQMAHPEALFLRAVVPTEPGGLPHIAAAHERRKRELASRAVRHMADHDSFLRVAVREYDAIQVGRAADGIIAQTYDPQRSKLPYDIARRTAYAAASQQSVNQFVPPTVSEVLLTEGVPGTDFLTGAWSALQTYVASVIVAEEEARGAKRQAARTAAAAAGAATETAAASGGAGPQKKQAAPPAGPAPVPVDGPFLCVSLALLPESVHAAVAEAAVARALRAATEKADIGLTAPGGAPSPQDSQRRAVANGSADGGSATAGSNAASDEAGPLLLADKRLRRVYGEHTRSLFINDLRASYREAVRKGVPLTSIF